MQSNPISTGDGLRVGPSSTRRSSKLGELVYLTTAQARCLKSQANGLYYSRVTGEYLKNLGENQYEVVIPPYTVGDPPPSPGGLMDDVVTDYDPLFYRHLYDNCIISANTLYQHTPLIIKEKEMEIGGIKCHLCGEELLYNGISRTMVKKHRNVESHQVYMCGTSIFTTWNERDCDMGCFDSKRDRHIHAECITHCCE